MSRKAVLTDRVRIIQGQLTALQLQVGEILEELEELSDFDLGASTPSTGYRGRGAAPKAKTASRSVGGSSPGTSVALRERAATETGHFFQRCLSGQARGASGRELIDLPHNIYVVVREFNGTNHTFPILRYIRWSCVRKFVCNPSNVADFGDSIFAGFHEEWEARLAVSVAGLVWPDATD